MLRGTSRRRVCVAVWQCTRVALERPHSRRLLLQCSQGQIEITTLLVLLLEAVDAFVNLKNTLPCRQSERAVRQLRDPAWLVERQKRLSWVEYVHID